MNSQDRDYKRFFIKTLGCKVNQYESEAMREILIRSGFRECLAADIADIYILNTCTVTKAADRESRHFIGLFHKLNPKGKIVVAGCYVENDADKVSFLPGVSHIVRNNEKSRIAAILKGPSQTRKEKSSQTAEGAKSMTINDFKDHAKAFVKIQDGCENLCSYCKVPLVRGPLWSKPAAAVVKEVKGLVDKGFKEIVLTGICLGAWGETLKAGSRRAGLPDLLERLVKIPGDFRIRLSSIEPRLASDELIDFISANKKICRHLHIPLQSGDDEILKMMNRPYTGQVYKLLCKKIRSKIKDVAITTDVLIGFPGETEEKFANTLRLVKEVLPSRTHIFRFSRREGTAAATLLPDFDKDVIRRRHYTLKALALGSSYIFRRNFTGRRVDVLVESKRDKGTGLLTGYSDNYIKVLFDGPDQVMRQIVPVKIDYLNLTQTVGLYE